MEIDYLTRKIYTKKLKKGIEQWANALQTVLEDVRDTFSKHRGFDFMVGAINIIC